MKKQKETATTVNSDGHEWRHFIPITDNEAQLQAFADLYRQGITKEQMTLILSTVRLNFEALGISAQPLLDSLSAYQNRKETPMTLDDRIKTALSKANGMDTVFYIPFSSTMGKTTLANALRVKGYTVYEEHQVCVINLDHTSFGGD